MLEAIKNEAQSSNGCNGAQSENNDFISERHILTSALLYALSKPKLYDRKLFILLCLCWKQMCHDATGTVGLSQESALAIVLNCALSIVYVDATSASHHTLQFGGLNQRVIQPS
jgi:hypothetical protein